MPRIVISNQHNPYLNIAVENYLLSQPSDGDITFYLWQNRRTVVVGQNQNPFAECDVALLEREGGYVMRRKTGGGAVFHDLGNLNFSFIVPYDLYDLQRQFSVLQRAVADYGLETEVSGRNDVLCQGRKFSGNAFSKGTHQRLHHGTILIRTDVADLQRYLRVRPAKLQKHGVASVQSRVVNLSELNPDITAQDIIPHLVEAFVATYGKPIETIPFDELAKYPEVKALADMFCSEEWKYGHWKHFTAQRSAQFEWGGVDLAIETDEPSATITHVDIATDSLDTTVIDRVRHLLTGASTITPPTLPADLTPNQTTVVRDIFTLLY